jgi:hypothetical protein
MLLLVTFKARDSYTEQVGKRGLELFARWKPPTGFSILHHYLRADGGGLAIVEADSAAAVLEFTMSFDFEHTYEVTPIVEASEAVPVFEKIEKWRS